MPIGKDIHRVISKKWKSRDEKIESAKKLPVKIKQSEKNVTSVAKPKTIPTSVKPRKIPKTEGAPAVNGRAGEEVVRDNVHKPRTKKSRVKAGDAAISPKSATESSGSTRKRSTRKKKTRQNKSSSTKPQ
jgi:hypothetical protein